MNEPSRCAARMALAYALAAAAWIIGSDYVLKAVAHDSGSFAQLGLLKGLAFVAVTAALLFWFVRREFSLHAEEQERLRRSEERLRVLVEQAVDAFFVHDENGKFVEVNRRACESLGYSKEELLRMGVTDVVMEFDLARAEKAWAQIQPGQDFMLKGRHRRKDGSTFPVEAHLGLLDANGRRLFLGLVRDITEREQAETEVRQSEEKFGRIFRASPVAIALTRVEDGRLLDVNESYCRLSGYKRKELIGRTTIELNLLVNPEERASYVETLRA
ncbi:MAG: PAS domain S-box protein, partial [Verrucomicrobia bacterium]|nr:PAS domain S-box protein [Verrucomicrobiota bacterium]